MGDRQLVAAGRVRGRRDPQHVGAAARPIAAGRRDHRADLAPQGGRPVRRRGRDRGGARTRCRLRDHWRAHRPARRSLGAGSAGTRPGPRHPPPPGGRRLRGAAGLGRLRPAFADRPVPDLDARGHGERQARDRNPGRRDRGAGDAGRRAAHRAGRPGGPRRRDRHARSAPSGRTGRARRRGAAPSGGVLDRAPGRRARRRVSRRGASMTPDDGGGGPASGAAARGGVALVHDYLVFLRGAERTFAAVADLWPGAPIYTVAYSERATERRFAGREIHASWLRWLRPRRPTLPFLLPLYRHAVQSLEVRPRTLVVSSSFAFAHGVRTDPEAVHVCYCHTPFRYAWHERDAAVARAPRPLRRQLARTLERIRDWDRRASSRVTRYVANSRLTQRRIERFYGREADVVHPPVDVSRFEPLPPAEVGDHLLLVGELVAHKRPEVALHAARPVIALASSGAAECVIDAETGVLVESADAGTFAEAMRELDFRAFDPRAARANAERFAPPRFQTAFRQAVSRACEVGGSTAGA